MGASTSASGVSLEGGDPLVQEYLARLAGVEGKVGTCLEEIEKLKTENQALRNQIRTFWVTNLLASDPCL